LLGKRRTQGVVGDGESEGKGGQAFAAAFANEMDAAERDWQKRGRHEFARRVFGVQTP
jgi:hypothetical protein